MRAPRRAGVAAFGVIALCAALCAAPAPAAQWTPAATVGAGADAPAVAGDAAGLAGVVYERGDAVSAALRPRGGPFGGAADLAASGGVPAIAVNASGAAIAAWSTESDEVQYAIGSLAGGLTTPGTLSSPAAPTDVSVGIDAGGNCWIAWVAGSGRVRLARRSAGGALGAATLSAADAESPVLRVSPSGVAQVAWLRTTETTVGANTDITTRVERSAGGAASTLAEAKLTIDADDVEAGSVLSDAQLALGPGGAPSVVWRRDTTVPNDPADEDDDVITADVLAAVDGGAPQLVHSTLGSLGTLALDESPDGAAVLAWDEAIGNASSIRASVRTPGAAFGAPLALASGGPDNAVSEPRAAVGRPAQPLVLWLRQSSAGAQLEASSLAGGAATPTAPPADAGVQVPALAADGEGNVIAAWTLAGALRVAAYDAAGPQLTDVGVPASGAIGQPVQFAARADDSWSGVAGYDWAFGDGAGATGAAVEHVYADAGRFPVTVTARDGAGNATQSAASPVDVSATPPVPPPVPPLVPPPAPPGPATDRVAPVVSGLALDRACLRAPVSAVTVRFTLSENARVLYAIHRWRKAASRTHCPHHRYRKRPDTTQPVDLRSGEGRSGENVATLARAAPSQSVARGQRTVRLASKGLRPGTYQLLVRATDAAGNRSIDRIVRFWVLRR